MSDMLIGIYEIVNNVNGKKYIGRTTNFLKRKSDHFNSLRKDVHYNKYLQLSFNKYGEQAFTFRIVEYCQSFEDTVERERYHIEWNSTEYNDKGYNFSYAHSLFLDYDSNRIVNKAKRKPFVKVWSEEERKRHSETHKQLHIDNPDIGLKISKSRTTSDEQTIYDIKQTLYDDLSLGHGEVAKMFNVTTTIVAHLCHLNCNVGINEKTNTLLANRKNAFNKRRDRKLIRLFRDGMVYSDMAIELGIAPRNVQRLINAVVTKHDRRMRDSVMNRAVWRRQCKVRTMYLIQHRDRVKTMNVLNISRSYFYNSIRIVEDNMFINNQQCS